MDIVGRGGGGNVVLVCSTVLKKMRGDVEVNKKFNIFIVLHGIT
jgi:hypothetical protein